MSWIETTPGVLKQVMKIIERVMHFFIVNNGLNIEEQTRTDKIERVKAQLISNRVKLDETQFGFVLWKSTTDAILMRQLHGKYLVKSNPLYLAFIDLKEPFDRVPCYIVVSEEVRSRQVAC